MKGTIVSHREIAARWSYAEVTGRFATEYVQRHVGPITVGLMSKISSGVPFEALTDAGSNFSPLGSIQVIAKITQTPSMVGTQNFVAKVGRSPSSLEFAHCRSSTLWAMADNSHSCLTWPIPGANDRMVRLIRSMLPWLPTTSILRRHLFKRSR